MKLKTEIRLITALLFAILLQKVESVIFSAQHRNPASTKSQHYQLSKQLVPKASLTQKGYIQFLRYVVDVPEITDYTFCIWVRSNNLTYNHPLLSYSTHEEERLIRVWISSMGSHINLELLDIPIFRISVRLVENVWYHVCQSWSSSLAAWSFYLNGKMKANGHAPKLRKVPIKSGGDIIVGQEYTDFDKGLDDGIEGDISGFNLVLASTFKDVNLKQPLKPLQQIDNNLFKRDIDRSGVFFDPFFTGNSHFSSVMNPQSQSNRKTLTRRQIWDQSLEFFSMNRLTPPLPLDNSHEAIYKSQTSRDANYEPKILNAAAYRRQGFHEAEYEPKILNAAVYKPQTSDKAERKILKIDVYKPQGSHEAEYEPKILNAALNEPQISHEVMYKPQSFSDYLQKPLGLLLVELSNDCGYLRGAPLSGKGVLVSWTRTNVRVFGGAILKTVPPFCTK